MNRRLQLLSTIALGTIAIVALFAYLLWSGYREKMESAATTTRNYAAIIEARLDATFRRAEAHLQELAKGLPLEALDKQAVPRFAKALDAGLDARRLNFPELVGLRVFDTAGDLIYASESATTQRANAADRDYFREARDNPGANLVFSEVAISRITGRPALFVAKAVRDDKGAFRGLVSASVELEYFQKLFESLDIGDGRVAGARVIAVHHVERDAKPIGGVVDAQVARDLALLLGDPVPLVAPQARALGDDLDLPVLGVDRTAAPAVLEHELRRRPRIERHDVVVDVAAERGCDHLGIALGEVVALADVVEEAGLHHQVMDAGLAQIGRAHV